MSGTFCPLSHPIDVGTIRWPHDRHFAEKSSTGNHVREDKVVSARFNRIGASLVVLLAAALIPAAAQMGAKGSIKGKDFDAAAAEQARRYLEEGRETFRFDTFGSEDFWGGKLKLH